MVVNYCGVDGTPMARLDACPTCGKTVEQFRRERDDAAQRWAELDREIEMLMAYTADFLKAANAHNN